MATKTVEKEHEGSVVSSGAAIAASTVALTGAGIEAGKLERADLLEHHQRGEEGPVGKFLEKWVRAADRVLDAWPDNVSIYASSRYDQTSGTNNGFRSRTGTYSDALLKSAGFGDDFLAAINRRLADSFGTVHSMADREIERRDGWAGIIARIGSGGQTPQSSKNADPLRFRSRTSDDCHAVVVSGYDHRNGMRLGFKDDGENLRGLFARMGVPGKNISEFGNTKSDALEAYLKQFKGKKGDRMVIFYSGHGDQRLSKPGRGVVTDNLQKQEALSEKEAKNVVAFLNDPNLSSEFVKFAQGMSYDLLRLAKRTSLEAHDRLLGELAKNNGLSRREAEVAMRLLSCTTGSSSTAVHTQVFQRLGATDPRHYDGLLQAQGNLTERDLKRMTRLYLSGFKDVVIISDSCYSGALVAGRKESGRGSA